MFAHHRLALLTLIVFSLLGLCGGSPLVVFPTIYKSFQLAHSNVTRVKFMSYDNCISLARKLCKSRPAEDRLVGREAYLRCYYPMLRTLFKSRADLVGVHCESWRTIANDILGLTNTVRVFLFDQLAHTFSSGLHWAITHIKQSSKTIRTEGHRNMATSAANAGPTLVTGTNPKQVCVFGGSFCPELAYSVALSIPPSLNYELLYVLSTDNETTSSLCGESTGFVDQDVELARTLLSAVFNKHLDSSNSEDSDLEHAAISEFNIEVMSDTNFLKRLLTALSVSSSENTRGSAEAISCDILYFRDSNLSYYQLVLSLIHQHRMRLKKGSFQSENSAVKSEIIVIKENFIPRADEERGQRQHKEDVKNGRMLSAAHVLADDIASRGIFQRFYLRPNGWHGLTFASSPCTGTMSSLILVNVTYRVHTVFSESNVLVTLEDYQGFANIDFYGFGYEPGDMAEVLIGTSTAHEKDILGDGFGGDRHISSESYGLMDRIQDSLLTILQDRRQPQQFSLRHVMNNLNTAKEAFYGQLCPSLSSPSQTVASIADLIGSQRSQEMLLNDLQTLSIPEIMHPQRLSSLHQSSRRCSSGLVYCDSDGMRPTLISKIDTLHVLISYSSCLFEDNSFALASIIRNDLSTKTFTDLHNNSVQIECDVIGESSLLHPISESPNRITLQLQIGCQSAAVYLAHYICFQSEQPFSFIFNTSNPQHYWVRRLMSNAIGLITSSYSHRNYLAEHLKDYPAHSMYVIPFYTRPYPHLQWQSPSLRYVFQLLASSPQSHQTETQTRRETQAVRMTLNSYLRSHECSRWYDQRATMGLTTSHQLRVLQEGYRRLVLEQQPEQQQAQHWVEEDGTRTRFSQGVRWMCQCPSREEEMVANFSRYAFEYPTLTETSNSVSKPNLCSYEHLASPPHGDQRPTLSEMSDIVARALNDFDGISFIAQGLLSSLVFDETPFDYFFYGFCSDSRRGKITSFHEKAIDWGLHGRWNCFLLAKDALFNEALQLKLMITRTVVNLHNLHPSSLQLHRILYLQRLGKCIVSERSQYDASVDEQLQDGVLFGSTVEDLINLVDVIANDRFKQLRCEARSYSSGWRLHKDTSELERLLQDSIHRIQRRLEREE